MDESDWVHEGVMDFLDNALDPSSGTIRGRGVFANPDLQLTPGTFARLRLVGSARYEAALVPDAATLSDQSRKLVMTVDADSTVVPKPVTLGPPVDRLRGVRSRRAASDRVVVPGLPPPRAGRPSRDPAPHTHT